MTRNKRKKQALSLLEVVIALALTSVVLLFLFSYFREITVADVEMQKVQEKLFARERVQLRLMQIFSNLTSDEKTSFFYTETAPEAFGVRLVFTFENGIDEDEMLSGNVKGVLQLAKNRTLELRTLPLEGKEVGRSELLMEHVKNFSFKIFDLEKKIWQDAWPEERQASPAMIKIILEKEEKEKVEFAFFLPASQPPVEYKEKT